MKKILPILPLACLFVQMLVMSCSGDDRWTEYYPQTAHNLWIDSIMRQYYLWNDEMDDTDDMASLYFQDAVSFLDDVRSSEDDVSRVDTAVSVPDVGYGWTYTSVQATDSSYFELITYVEPTSPAATAGIQRGDWVMQIDGEYITSSTLSLLTDGLSHELTMGSYSTDDEGNDMITAWGRVQLPAATALSTENMPFDSIYTVGNKTVGYLVCNEISAAEIDKMADVTQRFAAQGISDLVIDLRYCDDGDLDGLQYWASVLAPSGAGGSTMAYLQYAANLNNDHSLAFLDASALNGGVNLGLSSVYVLTSSATSGPAEMLINCLIPYSHVTVIGETTEGIATMCQSFSNTTYDYVLHLAVCYVYNADNGKYYESSGLSPDTAISQYATYSGILPLGNPSETLLATALEMIGE